MSSIVYFSAPADEEDHWYQAASDYSTYLDDAEEVPSGRPV
jgi:hypothetical protein